MINKKRVRALLLAGVMTMTMVLGGSSMAADGEGENDQITTTVQPMVTKVLEMAEGITVPDAAFSFGFVLLIVLKDNLQGISS